jgi:hypothetical protein
MSIDIDLSERHGSAASVQTQFSDTLASGRFLSTDPF